MIRSNPFSLLKKGSTIRSFWIRSLSCILKDTVPQILHFLNLMTCEIERFIANEIARSHKIVILLRNANFSLQNAVCLWKITWWEIFFLHLKKSWLSFVLFHVIHDVLDLQSNPDPSGENGSTIWSRSSKKRI